jgi:hypothetical protein
MLNPCKTRSATRAAILTAALLLGRKEADAAQLRLLVFLHLPLTQRALEKTLRAALPGIEVTAVGRVADFDRALAAGQDGILTLPMVLAAKNLKPQLHGRRDGSTDEAYALVGVGSVPEPARVSVVGVLDLLGRSGTASFVKQILGSSPKIERVTKVEDLLALLQMKRAEAVVLPTRLVAELRQMSRLDLIDRQLGTRVGLPAAMGTGPGAAALLAAIGRIDRNTLKVLGVDGWQ